MYRRYQRNHGEDGRGKHTQAERAQASDETRKSNITSLHIRARAWLMSNQLSIILVSLICFLARSELLSNRIQPPTSRWTERNRVLRQISVSPIAPLSIIFSYFDHKRISDSFPNLPLLETSLSTERNNPDFGDLIITLPTGIISVSDKDVSVSVARTIQPIIDQESDPTAPFQRSFVSSWHRKHLGITMVRPEDVSRKKRDCQQPSLAWDMYPSCNTVHEFSFRDEAISEQLRYLGSGSFRRTWLVQNTDGEDGGADAPSFVLKSTRMSLVVPEKMEKTLRKVHLEALIMERLTASDKIMDIYGYCGLSVFGEQGVGDGDSLIIPHWDTYTPEEIKDLNKDTLHDFNNFTLVEKIDLGLTMAESMAELHGFPDGIISNNDVTMGQWIKSAVDGKFKLNDFNNAVFIEWSHSSNSYCYFFACFGGDYHSPETFKCKGFMTEQADVFSFGNILFGILTGLWIFENKGEENSEEVQNLVLKGNQTEIDRRYETRSPTEARLVRLIRQCWAFDPTERPTIFEVVGALREMRALMRV